MGQHAIGCKQCAEQGRIKDWKSKDIKNYIEIIRKEEAQKEHEEGNKRRQQAHSETRTEGEEGSTNTSKKREITPSKDENEKEEPTPREIYSTEKPRKQAREGTRQEGTLAWS